MQASNQNRGERRTHPLITYINRNARSGGDGPHGGRSNCRGLRFGLIISLEARQDRFGLIIQKTERQNRNTGRGIGHQADEIIRLPVNTVKMAGSAASAGFGISY